MNRLKLLIIAAIAAIAPAASAQDSLPEPKPLRPVTSSYMLLGGSAHVTDTYLSPLKYSGWQAGFRYERLQAMRFDPERWVMRLDLAVHGSRTQNPRRNASMWGGSLVGSWGMMRRWQLPSGFSAGAGGSTTLDLGGLYNSRNGNNPATALASWTLDFSGYAAWNGRIGRLPVTARWQTTLPVTGIFFAPDYGELYYEIWLGNRSGLVHPIWWGNWTRWDNLVTADLHFGATTLRLGYQGNLTTWRVNGLTSRQFRHAFVLGITTEWIALPARSAATRKAKIISAQY